MSSLKKTKVHKIALNYDFGGFGLSHLAIDYLKKKKQVEEINIDKLDRTDPDLIQMIEDDKIIRVLSENSTVPSSTKYLLSLLPSILAIPGLRKVMIGI